MHDPIDPCFLVTEKDQLDSNICLHFADSPSSSSEANFKGCLSFIVKVGKYEKYDVANKKIGCLPTPAPLKTIQSYRTTTSAGLETTTSTTVRYETESTKIISPKKPKFVKVFAPKAPRYNELKQNKNAATSIAFSLNLSFLYFLCIVCKLLI